MQLRVLRAALLSTVLSVLLGPGLAACGGNIDPYDDGSQYAYGAGVGWLNFDPCEGPGVTVTGDKITGYVWAENIGWINLDPNDADPNTGISNDGTGKLNGLAWGENVGWINFDPNVPGNPNDYGATIDLFGNFSGYAWGENIGWINFNSAQLYGYGIKACKVNFLIYERFAQQWLQSPCSAANDFCAGADLDELGDVDTLDLKLFVEQWLDYCPGDWLL